MQGVNLDRDRSAWWTALSRHIDDQITQTGSVALDNIRVPPVTRPQLPSKAPRRIGATSAAATTTNLYVNHIPSNYTDAQLVALFAPHGVVASARVMRHLTTGTTKGYGFVELQGDGEAAIAALHGADIGGRTLHVSRATRGAPSTHTRVVDSAAAAEGAEPPSSPAATTTPVTRGKRGGSTRRQRKDDIATDDAPLSPSGQKQQHATRDVATAPTGDGTVALYMQGIPPHWNEARVDDLCRTFGNVVSVRFIGSAPLRKGGGGGAAPPASGDPPNGAATGGSPPPRQRPRLKQGSSHNAIIVMTERKGAVEVADRLHGTRPPGCLMPLFVDLVGRPTEAKPPVPQQHAQLSSSQGAPSHAAQVRPPVSPKQQPTAASMRWSPPSALTTHSATGDVAPVWVQQQLLAPSEYARAAYDNYHVGAAVGNHGGQEQHHHAMSSLMYAPADAAATAAASGYLPQQQQEGYDALPTSHLPPSHAAPHAPVAAVVPHHHAMTSQVIRTFSFPDNFGRQVVVSNVSVEEEDCEREVMQLLSSFGYIQRTECGADGTALTTFADEDAALAAVEAYPDRVRFA